MFRLGKTAIAMLVALTIVCLCAGCERDASQFEAAKQTDTISAYKEFIENHPNSEWAPEAQKAIARLTESADYENAVASNHVRDYEAFLARYPDSSHANDAAAAIEDLLSKMIQGRVSNQLRGWIVDNHVLVEVPVPLPASGEMNLGKFELRSYEKLLAHCIGFVPPADFRGGVSGRVFEERKATPLPVAGFRPAGSVQPSTGSTNVLMTNFYFPVSYESSLLVGEDITIKSMEQEEASAAASGSTFVLLDNGFHVRSEHSSESRFAGFKVSLEKDIFLLFVVEPLEDSYVQLVAESGDSRDVRLVRASTSPENEATTN